MNDIMNIGGYVDYILMHPEVILNALKIKKRFKNVWVIISI